MAISSWIPMTPVVMTPQTVRARFGTPAAMVDYEKHFAVWTGHEPKGDGSIRPAEPWNIRRIAG